MSASGHFLVRLALVASLLASTSAAAQVVRREYAIKAGVIAMLGKCVTWPATVAPARGQPLKIGILGKDPFDENGINQLDRVVTAERAKGLNIVVKRFASAKEYDDCHILFVSSLAAENSAEQTVADRWKAAKEVAANSNVLLIGETPGLARRGATANLLFDRTTNLIRLEINPDAAARGGLKLAPDLLRLKLVQIVRDAPP